MKLVIANWTEEGSQVERLPGGAICNCAEAIAAVVARAMMVAKNFIVLVGWDGVVWCGRRNIGEKEWGCLVYIQNQRHFEGCLGQCAQATSIDPLFCARGWMQKGGRERENRNRERRERERERGRERTCAYM